MEHTKAPWKYIKDRDNVVSHVNLADKDNIIGGTIFSPADNTHIARIWSDIEEYEANAEFICRAANGYNKMRMLLTRAKEECNVDLRKEIESFLEQS